MMDLKYTAEDIEKMAAENPQEACDLLMMAGPNMFEGTAEEYEKVIDGLIERLRRKDNV